MKMIREKGGSKQKSEEIKGITPFLSTYIYVFLKRINNVCFFKFL